MKIKVKRVRGGSMGDQRDYGLVTGSIWNYEDKPTTNQVSDRVGPVDRDEATIEAERGETVVGDINNDGMLEHFIVGGKRHFQGGTPLNVPDGSFVFSDTRALNIKNKDVLKNIFGVTASKGMTPAKVAKKFDLNQYNDLLLDPEADAISKRTAQMMLDNNLRKLGQLALVQEGMKGFPDGIPDIALPLFGTDQASSQPSRQMMRRGGLVKYQNAGQKKEMTAAENAAWPKPTFATKPKPGPAPKPKVKDPYAGFSPEYKSSMSSFDNWKKEWDAAVKSGDQTKITNLAESGKKLAKILDAEEIPGSFGFNWSWFDPRTTKVSPGTEQGMVEDAADVIYNIISDYDFRIKEQEVAKAKEQRSKTAVETANARLKAANEILADYQKKGHNSQYSAEDIKNARYIIEGFKPTYKQSRPSTMSIGTTMPMGMGMPSMIAPNVLGGYFDPKTDSATVANIIEKYPLSSFNQVQAAAEAENFAPGEQSLLPFDTTVKPDVQIPFREGYTPTDTSGQNIMYDPTASTKEQAVRTASKSKPAVQTPSQPSDIEIIEFLKEVKEGEDPTPDEITSYKRTMGYKRMGGDLPIHQSTGPVKKTSYNLTDKKFREAAKQKGLAINPSAWSWYDPNLPAIGPQTVLSSSGIFGRADSPKPIITELKNYPGVKDWTEYAPGGFDQWVADMAAAKGNPSKASEFWAKKRKEYEIGKTGMSSIDENVKGWNVPGVELMTPYVFGQAMPTPTAGSEPYPFTEQPVVAAAKSGPGAVPTPVYSPTSYYQPWSNYSNIDVMGAMMNYMDVNRGDLPTLYTYTPTQADPTFLDPARAIAQQQGLVAQSTEDIASRSFDPTTARANIIAAQAQSAEPIANIQAKYDEANTQIANQFAQQNAAALNDAQLKNIAFRDKYQGELQTLQQQYDNALREGRTEVAEAIKRAMVDQMQRGALNAQNINYKIGADGQIYYSPGYNPFTGENMYASAGYSQFNKLLDIYSKPPYNYTPENAIKAASAAAKLEEDKTAKYGMSVSNPMDIIWG